MLKGNQLQSLHSNIEHTLMLSQSLNSHKFELQQSTALLQQYEQLLEKALAQTVVDEVVPQVLSLIALNLGFLWSKYSQKITISSIMESKLKKIQQMKALLMQKQQQMKVFANKMQVHLINQLSSYNRLIKQCQKHNIKKMGEQHLNNFIQKICHSDYHLHFNKQQQLFYTFGHNPSGSFPSQQTCSPCCPYSQFMDFIKNYKSQAVKKKLKGLWNIFQKDLTNEIRFYVQQYGDNHNTASSNQLRKQLQKCNNEVMGLKVDMQILNNQIQMISGLIGIEHTADASSYSQVIEHMLCKFPKFRPQGFDTTLSHTNYTTLQQQLNHAFYSYFVEMNYQYMQENICYSPFKQRYDIMAVSLHESQRIYQGVLSLFQHVISNIVEIVYKKVKVQRNIQFLQHNINSINKEIRQKQLQRKQQAIAIQQPQSLPLTDRSNRAGSICQNVEVRQPKERISISARYNVQGVSFRVRKTMHISTIGQGFASKQSANRISISNSRLTKSSRISSRSSSTANILAPTASVASERIIRFTKNKLILEKDNPHFREEIEVNRIKEVKTNGAVIEIHFRKGFVTLEFLTEPKNNPAQQNGSALSRLWIKYFKALYFQYIDKIKFIDASCKDTIRFWQKQETPIQKQQQNESTNKQNINRNFITFKKSSIQTIHCQTNKYANKNCSGDPSYIQIYPSISHKQNEHRYRQKYLQIQNQKQNNIKLDKGNQQLIFTLNSYQLGKQGVDQLTERCGLVENQFRYRQQCFEQNENEIEARQNVMSYNCEHNEQQGNTNFRSQKQQFQIRVHSMLRSRKN